MCPRVFGVEFNCSPQYRDRITDAVFFQGSWAAAIGREVEVAKEENNTSKQIIR